MLNKYFATAMIFLMTAGMGHAADYPQSTFLYQPDTDFSGGDLRSIFETSQPYCEKACSEEKSCEAITYNTRSKACFLKDGNYEAAPYVGAMSAKSVDADPAKITLGNARLQRLSYLTDREKERAIKFRKDVARAVGRVGVNPGKLSEDNARGFINILRLATVNGNSEAWLRLPNDLKNHSNSLPPSLSRLRYSRLEFAINAYLDANDDQEAASLWAIFNELKRSYDRSADIVAAARHIHEVTGNDAETVANARAKYGPRVLDYDIETAASKPRVCFTFSEKLVGKGVNYLDYVQTVNSDLVAEVNDQRLCLNGMRFGESFELTLRSGLPANSGEVTIKPHSYTLYIPDRVAAVRFQGNGYVLPKGETATLPLVTVNAKSADIKIYRSEERNLSPLLLKQLFLKPLSNYDANELADQLGEIVWQGKAETGIKLNQEVVTALPVQDIIGAFEPGLYVMTARLTGGESYSVPATQWFLISDIGMTSFSGPDGLHILAKSLGAASDLAGIKVNLISRNNKILASLESDASGYVHFPAATLKGRAGNAPAAVAAHLDADFGFIDLTSSAFDFSDRGVEGRAASGAFDVFATTDRGIYQPGDDVMSTVLLRGPKAKSISDLPLTAITYRPDGQEYDRTVLQDQGAGGRVFATALAPSAQRGRWSQRIYLDTKDAPLADKSFLVEDFVPERIDFTPTLPDTPIVQSFPPELSITASYLYGASGANLPLSGVIERRTTTQIPAYPGFRFGSSLSEERVNVVTLPTGLTTNEDGLLRLNIPIPDSASSYQPEQLKVTLQMREGSGRPVERILTRAMDPVSALIGIKPLFDGSVPEGAQAAFEIIAVGKGMALTDLGTAKWRVERIKTNYQWFKVDSRWSYMPIKSREVVEEGTIAIGADKAAKLQVPLAWGSYELSIEAKNGGDVLFGSYPFYAGYYGSVSNADTPDRLNTGLDQDDYKPGETLNLRISAPNDGTAQIVVMNSGFVTHKTVNVQKGDTEVAFEIDKAWGAGAYILTSFIQPMDSKQGRNPTRAVGVNWVSVNADDKTIAVAFEVPELVSPNQPTTIKLKASSTSSGQIYATVAAVDLGILNITGFTAPDPQDYYFGQRKLGFEMRDLYGRLIDGFAGVDGVLRSGGDAGNARQAAGPKTETYLTLFSGLLTLDENGQVDVPLDIPEFNGTMRLMAVAWSDDAVGQASQDVLVRDPVVILANAPRFLAPGDKSSLRLEIAHAYGPAGTVSVELKSSSEIALDFTSRIFDLAKGERRNLDVPMTARFAGNGEILVEVKLPNGKVLTKTVILPVQRNDLPIVKRWNMTVAANGSNPVPTDLLAAFGNDAQLAVISQAQARLDVGGIVRALEQYPYGCTEQLISKAEPLMSFIDQLQDPTTAKLRIQQTITKVAANQATNGGFGLWRPRSDNPWLDAYATDFLVRAQKSGAKVPDRVLKAALSRLKNTVNNASDFDEGGEELAYALMVLANVGKASIGELRYYSDAKGDAFGTALAQAQLGVALAAYGEKDRSGAMFARAFRKLEQGTKRDRFGDFGSSGRDKAAVLALAVQAGSLSAPEAIESANFVRVASIGSTQEQAWALRLAASMQNSATGKALLNAETLFSYMDVSQGQAQVKNPFGTETEMVLTATGSPSGEVKRQSNGYKIRRGFYSITGDRVDMSNITQNDKIVVVIKVTPETDRYGRLMINDPLPAGFEIDNPNLLQSGYTASLPWLDNLEQATHTEFHKDRFLAAVDWGGDRSFKLAYVVRAISAGTFHQPAAHITDMYRADLAGNTNSGSVVIVGQ
ncbi:MAG: alpha-2-macroglobulin family protein [Amylibacter sp.]|nr:alpha-2-macroglobulin family protein [Amylibacter sp.]